MGNAKSDNTRVLVVDDSAVVRQIMLGILSHFPEFEVEVAANPSIADGKIRKRRPDVMLLDIEMPGMDGLTYLKKLMKEDPLPVVICSSYVERGSHNAIRALENGAVSIVSKPKVGIKEFLQESANQLVDAVRAAARAKIGRRRSREDEPDPPEPMRAPTPRAAAASVAAPARYFGNVVAMGASTGGTEALGYILQAMPENSPPIVIVQHMPENFTRAFAERVNTFSRITVKEAETGDSLDVGRALIAPGAWHLEIRRRGGVYAVRLHDGEPVNRHRPSVDVLFDSVAAVAGAKAVGVLLTGMGNDGARGLLAMRQAGARTIAQDERTSVVYGMPKEAVELGAAEQVLALERIPAMVLRMSASTGVGG